MLDQIEELRSRAATRIAFPYRGLLPIGVLVAASSSNCLAQLMRPATQARDLPLDGQRAHGELVPRDRRAVIEFETDGIEQQSRNDAFGRVSSQYQLHAHGRRLGCAAPCGARVLGRGQDVSLCQRARQRVMYAGSEVRLIR